MSTLDPRALRTAFGSFMTGVTVVTARSADGTPVGFAANSFASVSLDPPLLLVCPGKFLSSYDSFANCTHFAVNVLAEGQEEVSNTFSSFKGDRFARVAHHLDSNGVPIIEGAIAQFSCSTHQSLPAGDHCILIGKVQDFTQTGAPGLGYVGGQYFSLGVERAALENTLDTAVCGAIIKEADHVLLEQTPKGFRPPQITSADRGQMRQNLCKDLEARGIKLRLEQAYSVFDDRHSGTHFAYFLANSTSSSSNDTLKAVPIQDLAGLSYSSPAIAQMMARFALEARTGGFALYLGDAQRGDVHPSSERI
ncbi:flavin reductase family protein [Parasedimentitalea maritima]|uniref:Flavin reductase family protein n=1 Tax=Parasedimentitalea maritima TaxID=2578117 RepID=A0ABY2V314_9RHOB|nr:flavin reductase family protein [Zongyanglinia marina]TLP69390.1 flavin reductase family protein [Zongyanglinia marina]